MCYRGSRKTEEQSGMTCIVRTGKMELLDGKQEIIHQKCVLTNMFS